jgi:hypothetical protein
MLLFHNLEFFDKQGNNLNLNVINNIEVTIVDENLLPGSGAKLGALSNYLGQLESIIIYDGGLGYSSDTKIVIIDNITGVEFIIEGTNFITKDINGTIISIVIPSKKSGFTYPAFKYTGEISFNKVSVGLVESEHIYIAERVLNQSGDEFLTTPRNIYNSDNTYINNINVLTDGDEEIFLYNITDTSVTHPIIEKFDNYQAELNDGLGDTIDNTITRVLQISQNDVHQISIATKSDVEDVYETTLFLQVVHDETAYTFAEILFRAESVGEDERLQKMLENFGVQISEQEVKIFRDSDINESLPNYILLNEKRKELLLEYANIFPYVGSYKGLSNILNYFDYSDLRIKEYWLNVELANRDEYIPNVSQDLKPTPRVYVNQGSKITINTTQRLLGQEPVTKVVKKTPMSIKDMEDFFKKYNYYPNVHRNRELKFNEKYYKQVEIQTSLKNKNRNWVDESFLPNKKWKKTSLFSLHYDINKVTDDVDEFGIPIVEDAFMFSEEEALIKLFALKHYLKEKFLPLNARIIDIVGEGVYFERYTLNTWADDTNTLTINKDYHPDFTIDSSFYIEDLRNYNDAIFNSMETDSIIRNDLGPIGCVVNVELSNLDTTWDDIESEWDKIDGSDTVDAAQYVNTWDSLSQREYYEIEWIAKHNTKNKYYESKRYKLKDKTDNTFYLPYTGTYSIEMIMYDMSNHSVRVRKYIDIKVKEIELAILTRFSNHLETWDDCDIEWDESDGAWRHICELPEITWDSCILSWDDCDILAYSQKEPNDQFIKNNNFEILRISEEDRYIGNIVSVFFNQKKIICNGQLIQPKLRNAIDGVPQDYVYLTYDSLIFFAGVISATYSNEQTELILDKLPTGINNKWECLREIKNTILVNSSVSLESEQIRLTRFDYVNKKENILVNNIILDGDIIVGVELDDTIVKKPGEYGNVYRKKTRASNTTIPEIEILSENRIKINDVLLQDEIIPGFTEITMTSDYLGETFTQRLLVTSITYEYDISFDDVIPTLTVSEIDGDFSINTNAVIDYKYHTFNIKLVNYQSNAGSFNTNSKIELNFNDYPYFYDFVVLTGSPATYQLNTSIGDWYCDYATKENDFSLDVDNFGFENGNLLLTVNDENNELAFASSGFTLSKTSFDEDYAEKKLGFDVYNWNNLDEVVWDDLSHLQWIHMGYDKGALPGFEIININPGGTVQFNEESKFVFTEIPLGALTQSHWEAAVDELNNSTNSGISNFVYLLVELETSPVTYKIVATAKYQSANALGYIKFENGIEGNFPDPTVGHSYPLGNFVNWNTPMIYGPDNKYAPYNNIARTYYEYGFDTNLQRGWYPAVQYSMIDNTLVSNIFENETIKALKYEPFDISDPIFTKYPSLLNSVEWRFDESYRNLYEDAISGSFVWDDFYMSAFHNTYKKLTTICFSLRNCKMAGKKITKWQLRDRINDKILCETGEPDFVWTFSYTGVFDIAVEIQDINGNKNSITKNAFITIV